MTKCSHCSSDGHNSRSCPEKKGKGAYSQEHDTGNDGPTGASGDKHGGVTLGPVVKLFGVVLTDGSFFKKSASAGDLNRHQSSPAAAAAAAAAGAIDLTDDGYHSDGPAQKTSYPPGAAARRTPAAYKRKARAWTVHEHRLFLAGLRALGKGDWRGISREFIRSRTPTQVASHAQKYYLHLSTASTRRRRSTLFDMPADMELDPSLIPPPSTISNQPTGAANEQPTLYSTQDVAANDSRPLVKKERAGTSRLQVSKPARAAAAKVVQVEELDNMSQLSIGESDVHIDPLELSLVPPGNT